MRNIIDRFPWWLALAGTLPVLLAGVLEVERLQPVQENADHISQQAGTAETARRVNAQRLVRWEEEQLRRRRAAEVRTRREREGSRIETQMANRIDQMNASNPFFCREMVLHTEHVMSIYPDHSIRCVQHEWWEPKKERPDPRTFPAVLPAYSPWPPWYGQP